MIAASSRRVTLLIPGLFGDAFLPVGSDPSLMDTMPPASLSKLLARADCRPNPVVGMDARLFDLFGVSLSSGDDLPVASVTRLADMGIVDREWWIRADPVNLVATRNGLVLQAGLGLNQDEADRLVAELSEALAQDGWLLKAPRPERWYLKPPVAPAITTTPLARAIGYDIHPLLPQGPDRKAWHTYLNEFQILLHSSPVNAAREARGALPANSVWFWGGGRLPQVGAVRWAQLWSDPGAVVGAMDFEPLAQGLARLAGVPGGPVPANGAELLAQPGGGEQLLVLGLPAPILSQADAEAWQTALERLAHDWLTPLVAGVHAGTLAELTLVSDTGASFRYRRRHCLRFWRRPHSLAAYRAA
jgi:hypothetical protein